MLLHSIFFETIQCLDGCLLILQKQLGIVLGISQASFQFYFFYSATFLGGFSLTHITYSIFLFVKWREEKKVKFPLWAVSMLGCSWPRTFRNFSIKEGGTTCSKWASYLSILRSLSYWTIDSELFWSCINTGTNFLTMLVTRARANSSKNHRLLLCRIWKMGRHLF